MWLKLSNPDASRSWIRVLALLLWLPALASFAAENVLLQLRNGDRITGSVVSENEKQVTISTVWSKEVVVPVDQILKREKAPVESQPAVAAGQNQKTADTPATKSTPAAKPAPVAVAAPAKPITPKPPQLWHADFQLGLDLIYGAKDRQNYYGKANVTYAKNRFRNIFELSGSYGETEGILSANRVDGFIKTDFDLGKRVYVYDVAGASYDEIRKIDHRFEIGPGLGDHLLKLTNFVLNAEAGFNYQAEYRTDDTEAENFYLRFAEQTSWKINHRFSLDEKFELFPRVEDFSQYRFRLETTLKYQLYQNISLNLTVLDQYDTSPAQSITKNDLQIRSSIGVKF